MHPDHEGKTGTIRPRIPKRVPDHRHRPGRLRRGGKHPSGQAGRLCLSRHQRHLVRDAECRAARICRRRQRRHRSGVHRRCRLRVRHEGQRHGDRRGRPRRVRACGRAEVSDPHRAAHRSLPEGQTRQLRSPADGGTSGRRAERGTGCRRALYRTGRSSCWDEDGGNRF